MDTPINNQKPCVVSTPQGFSVSYNNRLLYSKYNPSKLILQNIENTEIMEGTIILCMSPCLCYGLKELINKIPNNTFIYLCDFDQDLRNIALSSDIYKSLSEKEQKVIAFPTLEELYNLPITIFEKVKTGDFRRIKRIDFSSGTQFSSPLYTQLENACIQSIKTFWTNRLTLTKFGRKYSLNLFKNLANIKNTTPLTNYFSKVTKPILVFGAGQSTDYIINTYRNILDNFYILCVDTALTPLIKHGIIPQGVFVEEAQNIISKAFICKRYNVQLFCGLSSLPQLSIYFKKENISFFFTKFTDGIFIDSLINSKLLPPVNPPFGSVGLTSVYYALKFRKDSTVPVCVTGLDFSYSTGFTHCRGSMAHLGRLLDHNRLICIDNLNAAFCASAIKVYDKDKNIFITTPSLSNYCNLFNNIFSKEKNLFDASNSGLPLNIPRIKLSTVDTSIKEATVIPHLIFNDDYLEKLEDYLKNEKEDLEYIRDILTGKIEFSKEQTEQIITQHVLNKEYLYLHYPDGYKFTYNQSFLNRIRTEIDYFLKAFEVKK